jgi:hypothetical protein
LEESVKKGWLAGLAVGLLAMTPPVCRAQSHDSMPGMAGMDSTDRHAAAAADDAMSGPMTADPHMVMTPGRAPAPGDAARAADLLAQMRRDLVRYRDSDSAIADGYRIFFPNVPQPVYHFTNLMNALAERLRFDPAHPTSLLYRKEPSGAYALVGAMYDDAPDTPLEELDRRVPLSYAHWHRHVNWCLPPRGAPERWREMTDGRPVFGPKSPIATAAECTAVGGRFIPHIFGWMVHVNAFLDDSGAVWSDPHGGAGH